MNEPGTPHLPVKSLSQSLTRRVLLLSLIGVVGLGSTIALGLMITLDQVQARMDGINAQAMSVFDRFFLEIESDLRATSEGLAARGDKNAALLQLRTRNSAFLDVFLISPEGVILAQRNAVGRPKQTKIEQPAWLESPPPFGKVVIGPVRFEGQTPYVDMAITATDDIGLPAGFLLVRVDLTELWNTTLDIKVGDTGYAYVADSAGQLVAFRNRRLLETGSNLEKLVGRTPQAIAASRPSFYTGLSGEPVLASAQPLKTVSWFAIVEQPVREALTPFMLPALFLLIALVVVGLLLYNIIRFTRVRIVSPLLALCDAVVQIADGQLKQSVEVRHDDELGQLARSFNSMVGQLQQAFAALQDRIAELHQTQESLRESEAIFASFMEYSPVYVFFKDKEIRTLRLSKNYEQMLGMPISQMLGKTMDELFPSDLAKSMVEDDLRILNQGQRVDIVEEFGGRVYETTKFPIFKDGQPNMLAGFTVDITERKRAEESLRQSEEKYRSIFENAIEGIFQSTPQGRFLRVNPAVVKMFGYATAAEMVTEITHIGQQIYARPEDREKIVELLKTEGFIHDYEVECRRKDGSSFWVSDNMYTVRDPDGAILYFEGALLDITERKQAEEALKESEELLRSIFVSTPDSITVADLHGRIILCNQATATIHGYSSPEQLVGKSFYELTAEQDRERAREGMKQVTMYGIVKDVPFIGLKGSGEKFDGELSVSLLQDSLGRPSGFVGITKDITERKRAEDALRESEVAFRELADSITDVFFAVDRDLRLTYWNKATEFLTRISAQDALGKSVLEVFRDTPKTQAIVSAYRDVLATQKAQVFVSDHVLGEKLHVFEISAYPSKRGISVFIKDITERKQAEEALKESERRWRFAIEASQGAYYEHSADMQQGWFSPRWAELYGYAPEEIPPLGSVEFPSWWEAHLHPDDRTRITNAYQAFLDGRTERYHYECRVRHKTGQWIWGEAIGIALQRDAEGKVTYVAGVAFNITERKQAEEQVKRSLAEKETLLRELYHRTKNNMQVIISLLKLQAADAADARLQAILRDIQNRIRSMALVHQKLYEAQDLSRVNLKEYMGELARLLMSSYEVQPGQITLVSETEDVFVLIDTAIPCGLILNELISNALRHAFPAGRAGEIRLQLGRTPDGEIHLRVADDGVGLPPGFDVRQDRRLGLQNIFDLGEYQLKGQVDFNTEQGVSCQISFRDNLYQPRV